jgi:NAD(P)-dependent dehydrogenase (short-subunit alcohol dehydrogenase family)
VFQSTSFEKRLSLSKLFSLKDKVAIVTGASRGVGKTTALAFVALGAKVTIASRNLESLQSLVLQNQDRKEYLFPVRVDVTRRGQVQKMLERTLERYGRIDILVNNAGIFVPANPENVTEEDWDRVLDTNLKGTFLCAQAVGKVMIAQGGGKIINVSSVSGSRATPIPLSAPYDASKGGIENLTRALAIAWAKYNVNVNAIAPCALESPMRVSLTKTEESKKVAWIPMGRRGVPEDLIGAMIFLSSPASDFMTGHVLAVDGGRLAW